MELLKEGLANKEDFVITCELVPGRGFRGDSIDSILEFAEEAKKSGRIRAVSLTDNAGGNPALSADVLGQEIMSLGMDTVVHFSCKDMNRNTIESRAFALKRNGVTNLLVVTGDYPISGALGLPKPVFDLDSVSALYLLRQMNEGLEIASRKKTVRLDPTDFLLGAVVSPFKVTEASAMMQYRKLDKKIRAGADFFITQLGYDSRKFTELIHYLRNFRRLDVPVIGSVYLLSAGAARYMNRGEVPGCFVNDRLLQSIREEAKAPDKGKGARLERAARLIAILKGLGYNGAHIEGLNLRMRDVDVMLDRASEIGENWRDHMRAFDYSPRNAYFMFKGGRSFDFLDRHRQNGKDLRDSINVTPKRRILSPTFWIMRLVHNLFFVEDTRGYRMMQGLTRLAEKRTFWYRLFRFIELSVKKTLFDCKECDDCALFKLQYLCAEARCPKSQRIGPCGGCRADGHCEVNPDRKCVWELIYWRAKNCNEVEGLNFLIPPRNWKLHRTSSWVNYFSKRDHSAVKLSVPDPLN
jgi:methylenetetrahydrofolate reductase (NADPH)